MQVHTFLFLFFSLSSSFFSLFFSPFYSLSLFDHFLVSHDVEIRSGMISFVFLPGQTSINPFQYFFLNAAAFLHSCIWEANSKKAAICYICTKKDDLLGWHCEILSYLICRIWNKRQSQTDSMPKRADDWRRLSQKKIFHTRGNTKRSSMGKKIVARKCCSNNYYYHLPRKSHQTCFDIFTFEFQHFF